MVDTISKNMFTVVRMFIRNAVLRLSVRLPNSMTTSDTPASGKIDRQIGVVADEIL